MFLSSCPPALPILPKSAHAGSGTAKIKVNPTQIRDLLGHPVQRVGKKVLNRNLGGLGERHLPVAPSLRSAQVIIQHRVTLGIAFVIARTGVCVCQVYLPE